jgi:hypothetical protein
MLTLAQRVVAIDAALNEVPHAFGGALALAYYAEPRATIDIDLNVFVPPDDLEKVLAPLRGLGAAVDDPLVEQLIRQDGQARVMWESTPIDLFFSYDAFHEAAALARHRVPFADSVIPILAPEHLVVCKVIFNRPKDWVDIEAVLTDGTDINASEVFRWVGRIVGDEDSRYDRIAALITHYGS